MLESRYVAFENKRVVFSNFHVSRQIPCFQTIAGLSLMDCELMDGNEYPSACCMDTNIQGKTWHCNTHYSRAQLFHLIVIRSHTCSYHHQQRNISVNTTLVGRFTVSVGLITISIQDAHLNLREQKAFLPMSLLISQEKPGTILMQIIYLPWLISVNLFGNKSVNLLLKQNSR